MDRPRNWLLPRKIEWCLPECLTRLPWAGDGWTGPGEKRWGRRQPFAMRRRFAPVWKAIAAGIVGSVGLLWLSVSLAGWSPGAVRADGERLDSFPLRKVGRARLLPSREAAPTVISRLGGSLALPTTHQYPLSATETNSSGATQGRSADPLSGSPWGGVPAAVSPAWAAAGSPQPSPVPGGRATVDLPLVRVAAAGRGERGFFEPIATGRSERGFLEPTATVAAAGRGNRAIALAEAPEAVAAPGSGPLLATPRGEGRAARRPLPPEASGAVESAAGDSTSAPPALLPNSPAIPARRSWNLELVARQADIHTRRGFELAGRRAFYAARLEFVRSLRLVAQGLDSEYGTRRHSQALGAGLTAMEEASDFIPRGSRLEAELDLRGIIEGHRTAVLKGQPLEGLTPMYAVQEYFTYAQEQLAAAGDGEVAAAMALYALGKLHAAVGTAQATSIRVARPKAMAFFQAALLVMPSHYMAANDLAVLLAGSGRYEDARATLRHSLLVHPTRAAWQNMAVVLGHLGRGAEAARAFRLASQMPGPGQVPDGPGRQHAGRNVIWLDPTAFARTLAVSPGGAPAAPISAGAHAAHGADPRAPQRQLACGLPPFWSKERK